MASAWPWLAVAGLGALHGLNPATGWMFAAAWGVQARDRGQALRALVPIAVGHAASVALVAGAVALGLAMDRFVLQALAGALLVVLALSHLSGRKARPPRPPAGHAGLALWSFMMSTAHGAGLMLVPALIPLCLSGAPGREISASGSLVLALAAVGVHTAAMLAVTGLMATGACRGFEAGARLLQGLRRKPPRTPVPAGAAEPFLNWFKDAPGAHPYNQDAVRGARTGSNDMIFQNLQLQKALDETGAARVTQILRAVPGVEEVGAEDGASLVAIAFDERTSLHELATLLAHAGHPLRMAGSGPCCGACGGCG